MMNAIRIAVMLVNCLRALIFDSREEYDFRSRKFNLRKVLIFILTLSALLANLIFINRIYVQAVEINHLKGQLELMNQKNTSLPSSDSEKKSLNVIPKTG